MFIKILSSKECGCVALLTLSLGLLTGCSSPHDLSAYQGLADNYDVVIERDNLGVPHIIGQTDADAAFGLAYAQAEDGWALVEDSIPLYRGINAKYHGQDAAAVDYLIGWLGIWETLDNQYNKALRADTRAYIEAFADGINFYAATHPSEVNAELFPMTGKDVVAGFMIRHLLFYGFDGSVRELTGSERARPISQAQSVSLGGVPVGSNAFAVAPHFSEDGATRLAINSHQPTTGPVAWYEAHIRSEEGLDFMGGLFPGSPTISLGFNENLAWGVTVNKPDLVDIYVLEIDPEDDMRYRLDGQWQTLEQKDVAMDVTLWGWLPWHVTEPAYRSIHGPVMKTDHGTYAVRYAGQGEIRHVQQWLDMNKARTFDEWQDAMRTLSFASFNFVYADAEGNIMHVHNSQTPKRKLGYDWQQYLPGDDSSLIWQDYLAFDELPLVINPPSGYVFSANQSPFHVTASADNPTSDSYPVEYGFPTRMTNRAYRGLELMETFGPISADEFYAIKHDKRYSENSRSAHYLQAILDIELPDDTPTHHKQAQQALASWDLNTDVENTQAALGVCVISGEWQAEQAGKLPPEPIAELARCANLMHDKLGTLEPRWGDVNRHIRGNLNLAVGGGPDTLRAIYGRGLEEDGYLTNVGGDGLYYLVSWDKDGNLDVAGTHQFGSATLDETSPHYADQAEAYAEEKLHSPLYFAAERESKIEVRYKPGERSQ